MDNFLDGRLSLEALLAAHDIRLADIPPALVADLSKRDLSYESIWAWCQLGSLFGRSLRATPILCSLLARDDHEGHEDLADTLQDLRDPRSAGCLFDRAVRPLAYLDYDDSSALARRCVSALHDIGTPEAVTKLRALTDDERAVVSSEATARLVAVQEQDGDGQRAPYRLARDRSLGQL